jgi:hypothetical protein
LQKAALLPANVFDSANGEVTLARNTNPTDVHTFASPLRHLGPHHVASVKALYGLVVHAVAARELVSCEFRPAMTASSLSGIAGEGPRQQSY